MLFGVPTPIDQPINTVCVVLIFAAVVAVFGPRNKNRVSNSWDIVVIVVVYVFVVVFIVGPNLNLKFR